MKNYYIHDGKEQKGPYRPDELNGLKLQTSTMVWCEGMADWKEAGSIAELKEYIVQSPPPFAGSTPPPFKKSRSVLEADYVNEIESRIPNKTGKRVFKISLLVFALTGLILLIVSIFPSQAGKERRNPLEYLKVQNCEVLFQTYGWRERVPEGKILITGDINNEAELTDYKDLSIEVEYFTNTETSLGVSRYVIFEKIESGEGKEISKLVDSEIPQNAVKAKWKLLDAEVVR